MDVLFFVCFFREGFFFFIVTSMSLFCLILEYYLKYQAMIDDLFCKHIYIYIYIYLGGFFFFFEIRTAAKRTEKGF
jgi:hypothetical protein